MDTKTIAKNKMDLHYSMKLPKKHLVNHLMYMKSHVDSEHIRTGAITDQDWEKLIDSADDIERSEPIMDDKNPISLNEIITWFQNPELIIIGARPAVGKTTFMLSTASEMVTNDNRNVCIFSLETSKEMVKNCLLTIGIAAEDVIDTKLIIDDTAQITIQELCPKCRELQSDKAIDAVFIDYLQLMGDSDEMRSYTEDMLYKLQSLKTLSRELGIPVVLMSQLSRDIDERKDHMPQCSDLRGPSEMKEIADTIIFLSRDNYYNKNSECNDGTNIIIAKQHGYMM